MTTELTKEVLDRLEAEFSELTKEPRFTHLAHDLAALISLARRAEVLEEEISRLQREVSREAGLRFKLDTVLREHAIFLADNRRLDAEARAATDAPSRPATGRGEGGRMSTVPCNHPAVTAAMWCNGQRLVLCATCYKQATGIAMALGVPLMADDLRDGETACTQKVKPERALDSSRAGREGDLNGS